jgi:hypothetical protein
VSDFESEIRGSQQRAAERASAEAVRAREALADGSALQESNGQILREFCAAMASAGYPNSHPVLKSSIYKAFRKSKFRRKPKLKKLGLRGWTLFVTGMDDDDDRVVVITDGRFFRLSHDHYQSSRYDSHEWICVREDVTQEVLRRATNLRSNLNYFAIQRPWTTND